VSFGADSTTLVVTMRMNPGAREHSIELWNAVTQSHLKSIVVGNGVRGAMGVFTKKSGLLAALDDGHIQFYQPTLYNPSQRLGPLADNPSAMAPHETRVAIALGEEVLVLPVDTNKTSEMKRFPLSSPAEALQFAADGKTLFGGTIAGTVHEWPLGD
jgi:hypothetical protein